MNYYNVHKAEKNIVCRKLTCADCMYCKNGDCFGSTERCKDFRYSPQISYEERQNWPEYGDATSIKLKGHVNY